MVSNNFSWCRWLQIFGKILELKLKKIRAVLYRYDKDYMKIIFERNDNLPTCNIVNMHQVTIIIRSVFAQNGKFYPQLFLDDALYNI